MSLLLNLSVYQALWLVSILAASKDHSLLGPILVLVWLPIHLTHSPHPRADALLVLVCSILGTLLDAGYMAAGWVQFNGFSLAWWLPPMWITALWACFALTLNHALVFLRGRLTGSILFGGIGGALAYWAGAALGAARLNEPTAYSLGGIAAVWCVICPALIVFAQRIEKSVLGKGEV